jgi:hypothetical protein
LQLPFSFYISLQKFETIGSCSKGIRVYGHIFIVVVVAVADLPKTPARLLIGEECGHCCNDPPCRHFLSKGWQTGMDHSHKHWPRTMELDHGTVFGLQQGSKEKK